MEHDADAAYEEAVTARFGPLGDDARRQRIGGDDRNVDAALLECRALRQHARQAPAADDRAFALAFPIILMERRRGARASVRGRFAFDRFGAGANAQLQILDQFGDRAAAIDAERRVGLDHERSNPCTISTSRATASGATSGQIP